LAQTDDRAARATQAVAERDAVAARLLDRALEVQDRAVRHLRAEQDRRIRADAGDALTTQRGADVEGVEAAGLIGRSAVVAARACRVRSHAVAGAEDGAELDR